MGPTRQQLQRKTPKEFRQSSCGRTSDTIPIVPIASPYRSGGAGSKRDERRRRFASPDPLASIYCRPPLRRSLRRRQAASCQTASAYCRNPPLLFLLLPNLRVLNSKDSAPGRLAEKIMSVGAALLLDRRKRFASVLRAPVQRVWCRLPPVTATKRSEINRCRLIEMLPWVRQLTAYW